MVRFNNEIIHRFSNEISVILQKHFRVTLNEYIETEKEKLGYVYADQHKDTSASSQYSKSE